MTADECAIWRLYRGKELLGLIHIDDADFPWLSGRFLPQPGFAEVKPLFDEEIALCEQEDLDVEAWEAAYERIREAGLVLVAPDGHPAAEFLLHIRGDEAWFRWSDEPFETA